jgi:diphthine-ammonia ligase
MPRPERDEPMSNSHRVAILFSGGKESCYALWWSLHQGFEVSCLLTFIPRRPDAWLFHYPTVSWVRLQAQALGIPHEAFRVEGRGEDEELGSLKKALGELKLAKGIEAIVYGVVESSYQKRCFDRVCHFLGLKSLSPLWLKEPRVLILDMLKMGFRIVITRVSALGFDESWLGSTLDIERLRLLEGLRAKYGLHISGEGGEYETFVLDMPLFKERIAFIELERHWIGDEGYLNVRRAILEPKA